MNRMRLKIFFLALTLISVHVLTGCNIITLNDIEDTTENSDTPDSPPIFGDVTIGEDDMSDDIPVGEGVPGEVTVSSETLARRFFMSVYRKKFDDITFLISTTNAETIQPETITSDVSQARVERNSQIQNRYGIKLITRLSSAQNIYEETKIAVNSGKYYTDLLALPQSVTGALYADGLLLNLKTLPYINLESEYFDQSSIKACSGGFGVYGLSGEALFNPNNMTGMYINKDMLRNAGLDLPYASVYDGTWTWDKTFALSAASTANVDGEPQTYSYASMLAEDTIENLIYASSGLHYAQSDVMAVPEIAFTPTDKQLISTVEAIKSYLNDARRLITDDPQTALSAFNSGNSLYLIDKLYVMSWMANSSTDWGIVPMPKISESQDGYKTLADRNSLIFSVPRNNVDAEATSIVLQAMNAASYRHMTDAYIDDHMTNILRDGDSVNMLDLITRSQTFDSAFVFGSAYQTLSDGTIGLISRAARGESLDALYQSHADAIKQTMTSVFPMSH
jgi:hypothetical protein